MTPSGRLTARNTPSLPHRGCSVLHEDWGAPLLTLASLARVQPCLDSVWMPERCCRVACQFDQRVLSKKVLHPIFRSPHASRAFASLAYVLACDEACAHGHISDGIQYLLGRRPDTFLRAVVQLGGLEKTLDRRVNFITGVSPAVRHSANRITVGKDGPWGGDKK